MTQIAHGSVCNLIQKTGQFVEITMIIQRKYTKKFFQCCWGNCHKCYNMCRGEVELRQKKNEKVAIGEQRDTMKFKSQSIVFLV